MTRRKKVVSDPVDGTPIETDEDLPVEDAAPTPAQSAKRLVEWTQKGEDAGAWSEHGMHKAGEKVETTFADLFVSRGWAKEVV